MKEQKVEYRKTIKKKMISSFDSLSVLKKLGKEKALDVLQRMLLIRNFETRAESAYQQGLIGGFFHSYAGQEAIQTSIIDIFGKENWYIGFYRCHALALLLGSSPNELMAELFGKSTGNAKGRGGSMHLYAKRLLGGFAIVGGHLPIAIGAAFSLHYLKEEGLAICFLGEGAVAQGAFHESLNLASLWNLPVLFIIENNKWGMGTHVSRAIACKEKIAETLAPAYKIKGYTLNGMDYIHLYAEFQKIKDEMQKNKRPILVECLCERFRGHSISDPALYRSKGELEEIRKLDPILRFFTLLEKEKMIDEATYKEMDKEERQKIIAAMQFAETSPWPSLTSLEEEVYAP